LLFFVVILRGWLSGSVQPFFSATPTPTRTSNNYALEGEMFFTAGDLTKSINAYKNAHQVDPGNAALLSELARIQAYSTRLLTTDDERRTRMQEALSSINEAVKLAPDDSTVNAIRAFVLDWYASPGLAGDQWQNYLSEAEKAAVKALQLDNQNALALAYYAEILVDEQKWIQGQQYIDQALARGPSLMDVHRIAAYTQESTRNYTQAIEEYQKAAEIAPNLTFLYLAIGANYRTLAFNAGTDAEQKFLYEKALEYFAKVTTINERLGVADPIPYLSIARTYAQMGEFFSAARNAEKALTLNPTSPDVYGQLGIIYFRARNYEGSIPAFKCAIRGCTPEESCAVRKCNAQTDPAITITGMPLTANTAVYYYTYGSVLAALHKKSQPYCDEAMKVFAEVRAGFPTDTTAMGIVKEGENICMSYGYTRP
jgi:tetratricopeptide (TPR) repeat protein